MISRILALLASLVFCSLLSAQVYSPKLLREGQQDSTDLKKFTQAIYSQAGAVTPRQKAEAIWRFFLTDGRFVKPGFWYHIAGWTYEEPSGEVLDPMKLLNSYGFGLCYHIAPLLEAVFEAGGFADARCWFLTGHTVTEVFYDGRYHYFDSDMMGYNVAGEGPFQGKPVVSVHELEGDRRIILDKLATPGTVKPHSVDDPWYPADVRARAMGDLADLFTTTSDNRLYPYTRYSPGHSMDFVLRPGEKLIRFFAPEDPGLFYLPYKFDGKEWTEFPQEISEYHIRTADGPRSQKDGRLWATGRIEYTPPKLPNTAVTVIDMPSPYVIIDARFTMNADLPSAQSSLRVETSTDGGRSWALAGERTGPLRGEWSVEPAVLARTTHGKLTAVSGSYGYKVRITSAGSAPSQIRSLQLVSRVQLNPRTLPMLQPGNNTFEYSSNPSLRRVPVPASLASATKHFALINQQAQPFLLPAPGQTGEAIYTIDVDGCALSGFEAGARFLDMPDGVAPDKLTAEVRKTGLSTRPGEASLAWSTSPTGPFEPLWSYPQAPNWRDNVPIDRLLSWPEVFRSVHQLPAGTTRIYVRLRSSGPAVDSVRLAAYVQDGPPAGRINVTQLWREGGAPRQHAERFSAAAGTHRFQVQAGPDVENVAVMFAAE